MTDTELRAEIAAERRALADIFAALPEASWDEPSLCAGWRVREVVAHVTMPFRYSRLQFIRALARDRGNVNRMADRCARRDAARLTSADLVAAQTDNVDHPWRPPGGGYAGALTHDVVHGLDCTIALGIERDIPEQRLRAVLDGLTQKRGLKFFGVDLAGVQLRAADLDWTFGAGEPLVALGHHLVLLLSGRTVPGLRSVSRGSTT